MSSSSPTSNANVTMAEQVPELSSNMYGSQEGVSPFVEMTETLPVEMVRHEDKQQHGLTGTSGGDAQENVLGEDQQQEQRSDVECSGMSDVGGDGNSIMEEDGNELKHVVEVYGDISPYEEEFDSAMSDLASEEERREIIDSNIKTVIDGYDDISSADELDNILEEVDKSDDILEGDKLDDILEVDKLEDSIKIQNNTSLVERAVGSEDDNLLHSPGGPSHNTSVSATEEEKVKEEEEQHTQLDEFADPIVVTEDDVIHSNDGQGEASGIHGNQGEISSPSNKMEEIEKAQDGKLESSGGVKKIFSPFAFVEKQSRKALSWQKFRGTDDSLHKDEDVVGPVTGLEDVEGPTSVSKGDNVMDRFDGLVPEAVLRHNANKRKVFKPTIPVRRQFRKKQKLVLVTDVNRNYT
ncbi:hypothetical protein G6F42_020987 [Rhizopus arrhizus]|nr:hypothetical protein G6F42_020987 [Rhizopus arrhizus]